MMLELLLGALLAAFAVGYVLRPLSRRDGERGTSDGPDRPGP
jgi:hypothetical protein